ncbi:hypothetical protein HOLleu_36264 [Holothuria leucospilota]|uniref:Uncharacterized protein n=1 Tax=Holothuria leucospilota TaxID=206669 RepID=A0A9Q1BDJ1_HOLLE|nr:hypothetical protein HOLleu_36264 [Holothuria leucospilota]
MIPCFGYLYHNTATRFISSLTAILQAPPYIAVVSVYSDTVIPSYTDNDNALSFTYICKVVINTVSFITCKSQGQSPSLIPFILIFFVSLRSLLNTNTVCNPPKPINISPSLTARHVVSPFTLQDRNTLLSFFVSIISILSPIQVTNLLTFLSRNETYRY